ncbi:MAG: putative glycosyltransferase epsH [Segetibacter sp.]|nr:putative glycosyltransferase epsH [Segetibacter sp.]
MNFSNSENKQSTGSSPITEPLKLVSIVLATYNGERYLTKQLESLFNQSYQNIEIIAVDDCSKDKTIEILQEHAARHANMKVFVNEVNLGFIKNFEKGCTLSNGDLIAFCDQDDYWDIHKIKKLAAAIGNYPIIYSDSLVCDENLNPTGTKISDLVNFRSWSNCLQLAVFCRIYAHAMVFKRSFFDTTSPFLEVIPPDWWLPYLSTFHGGMKYFPEPLVLYRQHAGNVTGVIGGKGKKNNRVTRAERTRLDKLKIRARINAFYKACPDEFTEEKKVLQTLVTSYQDFSLINNFRRLIVFLRYRDTFLSVKKHSALHRFFFCFKMFVKIK